jgi:hypothetical protein
MSLRGRSTLSSSAPNGGVPSPGDRGATPRRPRFPRARRSIASQILRSTISRRDVRLTRIFTPYIRRSIHSANAVVAKHERVGFASTGEKINCDICQVSAVSTREKRA